MVYKQKLTKIGNSVGVILPKELRNTLGIDLGAEVYLETNLDNKTVVLNSSKPNNKIEPQFFELVKEVDKQYSSALKELASK